MSAQQAQASLLKAAYVALDALDHYQHGGSEYRKIAAAAYERLSTALAAHEAAPQQAQAPGWQLARVSDGDIRVYGPDKETWLIHKDCGEGFYDFIYRYFEAAIGAAPQQGSKS